MNDAVPVLSFSSGGLSFSISSGERLEVLQNLTLAVQPGEIVAIVGPSGCGKSTILNVLTGEVRLSAGELEWTSSKVPRMAAMWQEEATLPFRTALENVAFPLEIAGRGRAERETVARKWLQAVGLKGFERSYPAQLSGGMKKRVSLAAALAAEPELLLLDEPLGALDHYTKLAIQQEILAQWEKLRPTIVLVTHAADEAVAMADRIIVLTGRPARVFHVHVNPLPRPRRLEELYADAGFHNQCREVWAMLKEAAAQP